MNRKKYIIVFILLLGFVFNFAHSELGFMTSEGDVTHYAHDFCLLTNTTSVKVNYTDTQKFIQKHVVLYSVSTCILPVADNDDVSLNIIPHYYSSSGTPLSVINRTLLI